MGIDGGSDLLAVGLIRSLQDGVAKAEGEVRFGVVRQASWTYHSNSLALKCRVEERAVGKQRSR